MLFDLSRYDFRLPRYRRVKTKAIFNRLLSPSFSLTRNFHSHLVSLTYPKLQTSDRRDSWKNVVFPGKNVGHEPIHNICVKRYVNFKPLYLGNRLRYRDKSKSEFNGMVSSIFWVDFNIKIFSYSIVNYIEIDLKFTLHNRMYFQYISWIFQFVSVA